MQPLWLVGGPHSADLTPTDKMNTDMAQQPLDDLGAEWQNLIKFLINSRVPSDPAISRPKLINNYTEMYWELERMEADLVAMCRSAVDVIGR